MAGFDDLGVYFSDNILPNDDNNGETLSINANSVRRRFKDFLRQFHAGDFQYKYREQIKKHYSIEQYWIEVSLADLITFDEELADKLNKSPIEYLKIFESAATELADEITKPRVDDGIIRSIQVQYNYMQIIQ